MPLSLQPQWQLRVMDDGGSEVDIPVDRTPKCVGRGEEQVDIRLMSSQVSRRHAEFWVDADGGLMVRDLKSTNGTEVNGLRLQGVRALVNGDVVRVGRWEFTARDRRGAEAVAAQRPEPIMSSAESIAAIDALLDSHGNLRLEDSARIVAAKLAAKQAAAQAEKPKEQAPAPKEAVVVPAAKAKEAVVEIRIEDDLDAADMAAASLVSASLVGHTMAGHTLAGRKVAGVMPASAEAPVAKAAPAPVAAPKAEKAAEKSAEKVVEKVVENAKAAAAAETDLDALNLSSVGDFVDSQAGMLLFEGSQAGLTLEDSSSGTVSQPTARACDLHLVGEGRAPGVSAADLCAIQAFAERQLVVPGADKRRRLLCEFTTGGVFRRNLSAVVAVSEGKIEPMGAPVSSLPGAGLHIEKNLVRRAAQEKRAIVAWDAHFPGGASAVAVCCPLTAGEFLYAVTTFENATPAWMALLAQTAFMDRLIRKSWSAIDKMRQPAALPLGAAA